MKNVFVAGLMAALLALGCTSTPAATTPATTTDTAAGADTATDTGGAGDATTDTTAGTDAAADTAKADGTTTTDVKKDTAPVVTKCGPTDDACFDGCVKDGCAKEQGDCTKDSKCFGLTSCLNGCQKVDLPTDLTATNCYKKCLDTAGEPAAAKLYAAQTCGVEKCLICPASDQNCRAMCSSGLCLEPIMACQQDNECATALKCALDCKDQSCVQDCAGKYPTAQMALSGLFTCLSNNQDSCAK